MRFAYAGHRDISVRVLEYLLDRGDVPEFLLVADSTSTCHAERLIKLCGLPPERILCGSSFREPAGLDALREADLDMILSIHFPYLVTEDVLDIPTSGVLNLHPSYLPWNRGWHTPTWCILDGTPAGGSLHFMNAGIDTGDIIDQLEITCEPWDTADSLYSRILDAEYEVFVRHWPTYVAGKSVRRVQDPDDGSSHLRADLRQSDRQRIDLDQPTTAREVLTLLRSLTTNRIGEAAYFEANGQKMRVQISISPDKHQTFEDE
jgi:methionyl-tRNA formyltransferase